MHLFLSNFHLGIGGRTGYLVLLAMVLMVFTIFIYRRTNPIVPRSIHYFLIAVRMIALLLLLVVLFQTTISWQQRKSIPPLLAIAIDQSASMNLSDAMGHRPAIVRRLLMNDLPKYLDNDFKRKYFGFAEQVNALPTHQLDSLNFAGDATNLTACLGRITALLQQENLGGILLLTDGNYTHGGNPVRYASELHVPLFIIGVGASASQHDLAIIETDANAFAFVNEATPISVTIRNRGFENSTARVRIADERGEVASINVKLTNSPLDTTLTFQYTPYKEGRQRLNAEVMAKEGEQSYANNRKSIYLDVLKSKLKILILSGTFSADISFLRRHLSENSRLDIRSVVESVDGSLKGDATTLSNADSLDLCDLIILHDFPTSRTQPQHLAMVASSLKARNRPVIFLAGKNIDWRRLQNFEDFLPFRSDVVTVEEITALPMVTATGKLHPVMQIPGREVSAWNLLPPIFIKHKARTRWPDTDVLATARVSAANRAVADDPWPLILVRNSEPKSAAVMGYELWRWHLMMAGIGNEDEVYHHFVNNLIRWLQIEKRSELIRVTTDKSVYHFGESIHINAFVYDAQLTPISDAQAHLAVKHEDELIEIDMTSVVAGKYTAVFQPGKAGDYDLTLQVLKDDETFGRAQTQFTVGEYNQELNETAMQALLLQELAHVSGGKFAPADSAAQLLQSIHGSEQIRIIPHSVEIWNQAATLLAIIFLLTSEWYVRKKRGMV